MIEFMTVSGTKAGRDRCLVDVAKIKNALNMPVREVIVPDGIGNPLTVLKGFCDSLGVGEAVPNPQDYEDSNWVVPDIDLGIELGCDAISDILPVGLYCRREGAEVVITNEVRHDI